MREILFRGKRTDGQWICGSLLKVTYDGNTYNLIFADNFLFILGEATAMEHAAVDPFTVGQFTGLTANGKKIFEGDVIQFHKFRGEPDWIGVVKYEHCSYIAAGRMPLAYEKRIGEEPYFCPFEVQISGIDKDTIKVLGNIHDNPELLGGAEDVV